MQVKSLYKSYGQENVLKDVSFEIPKKKLTSFIGPNGAGKSTALNIISRLIERDSGEVIFHNKDLKNYKSKDLAQKMAILTQQNNIQMKLKVHELVEFGRFPYSGSHLNEEDIKKVDMALDYMELNEFKYKFIDELSGGQVQRAFIAMVIAQDTEYIFLDEPTNNLDIYHSSNFMKMTRKLCDDLGKTIILVMHEINFAAFYSDYICAFKDGEVFNFGKTDEVLTRGNLKSIYNVDFEMIDIKGKKLSVYF